jgi:predicted ABC-type ATPase
MNGRKLFIIAGANGSGKTTISTDLLKNYSLEFLNADEMARAINPGNMQMARIEAGKRFLAKFAECVSRRLSFAVESTLSGLSLKKRIEQCRTAGYEIIIIYLFLDSHEVALHRIKTRVRNGGHAVPSRDVIRRFYRSRKNFWNIYRHSVDKWMLYYNGEDLLVHVAAGWNEQVEIHDEAMMNLFQRGL